MAEVIYGDGKLMAWSKEEMVQNDYLLNLMKQHQDSYLALQHCLKFGHSKLQIMSSPDGNAYLCSRCDTILDERG